MLTPSWFHQVLLKADGGVACTFWFLRAAPLRESPNEPLLTLQEMRIRHPDWLVQKEVDFEACIDGNLRETVMAVSHRCVHSTRMS